MVTTNKVRGRPRHFDPEQAVSSAQGLFHAHGYDAVSITDMTNAMGINPPSFYAAFGNKVGLYKRVLDRYAVTKAIPFADILRPDRSVSEALGILLEEAARRYGADRTAPGCMVIEGTRCNDPDARDAASVFHKAAEEMIRLYIAERYPADARRVTDFVSVTMAGLSAEARSGCDTDRLLAVARLASLALTETLKD